MLLEESVCYDQCVFLAKSYTWEKVNDYRSELITWNQNYHYLPFGSMDPFKFFIF